jgi:hypothetical protein
MPPGLWLAQTVSPQILSPPAETGSHVETGSRSWLRPCYRRRPRADGVPSGLGPVCRSTRGAREVDLTPITATRGGAQPAVRPVIAAAGEQANGRAVPAHNQPIAIVLDLVNPARPRRRFGGQGRDAGIDEAIGADAECEHEAKIGALGRLGDACSAEYQLRKAFEMSEGVRSWSGMPSQRPKPDGCPRE